MSVLLCDFAVVPLANGRHAARCKRCGATVSFASGQTPNSVCVLAGGVPYGTAIDSDCPHLGDLTEEDTAIEAVGCCPGNTRTHVWGCDLHDRCTPYARSKDATIRACRDCPDGLAATRGRSKQDVPAPGV